jgi:hypothetical protein
LSTIAGLRAPASGTITVDGQLLGAVPAPLRVAYLGQDHRLIGTLTSVENLLVSIGRSPAGQPGVRSSGRVAAGEAAAGVAGDQRDGLGRAGDPAGPAEVEDRTLVFLRQKAMSAWSASRRAVREETGEPSA